MAGSGLGAVSTGDAAGPAGVTHAVGEPKRQRQPIGHSKCVSITFPLAFPLAIADPIADPIADLDGFASALANSDGIAISVPELISD